MATPDKQHASGKDRPTPGGRRSSGADRLGWIALAVAAVLTAWQVIYATTAPGMSNPDVYTSVWLLVSLVLAVGAVVLGIVALGQHAKTRWAASAALAVGSYAFIVSVATWVGDLMG